MANFISYGGIGVQAATFELDATTKTAIAKDFDSAVGKAVALTGNNTVGYGTSGGAVFGFVLKCDARGLATVQYHGFREDVPISATAANQPALGGGVCVDGKGGIVKPAADAASGGKVTCVDTTAKTAVILL